MRQCHGLVLDAGATEDIRLLAATAPCYSAQDDAGSALLVVLFMQYWLSIHLYTYAVGSAVLCAKGPVLGPSVLLQLPMLGSPLSVSDHTLPTHHHILVKPEYGLFAIVIMLLSNCICKSRGDGFLATLRA